jgi:hypothetical protein
VIQQLEGTNFATFSPDQELIITNFGHIYDIQGNKKKQINVDAD